MARCAALECRGRKDYSVGANLTGLAVDDRGVNFYAKFYSTWDRNDAANKNPEVDKLIELSRRPSQ